MASLVCLELHSNVRQPFSPLPLPVLCLRAQRPCVCLVFHRDSPFALDGQDELRMELDLADAMGSCSTTDEGYTDTLGPPPPLATAPTLLFRRKMRPHEREATKSRNRRRAGSERVRHVSRQEAKVVVTAMIDSIFKNLLADQNDATGASLRHELETHDLTFNLVRSYCTPNQ